MVVGYFCTFFNQIQIQDTRVSKEQWNRCHGNVSGTEHVLRGEKANLFLHRQLQCETKYPRCDFDDSSHDSHQSV